MDLLRKSEGGYVVTLFSDDRIIIDRSLPKHKKEDVYVSGGIHLSTDTESWGINNNNLIDSSVILDNVNRSPNSRTPEEKLPWWNKLFKIFKKDDVIKENPDEGNISVLEFFSNIKTALNDSELEDYKTKIENYLKEMSKAKAMGQVAIYEQMKNSVDVMKLETVLQVKKVKFITQEQLITLGKNAKRGIKIDYIKNFARIVPDDIFKKKQELMIVMKALLMRRP